MKTARKFAWKVNVSAVPVQPAIGEGNSADVNQKDGLDSGFGIGQDGNENHIKLTTEGPLSGAGIFQTGDRKLGGI